MKYGIMFLTHATQPAMVKMFHDEHSRDKEYENVKNTFTIFFGHKTINVIQCSKITAEDECSNHALMKEQWKQEMVMK